MLIVSLAKWSRWSSKFGRVFRFQWSIRMAVRSSFVRCQFRWRCKVNLSVNIFGHAYCVSCQFGWSSKFCRVVNEDGEVKSGRHLSGVSFRWWCKVSLSVHILGHVYGVGCQFRWWNKFSLSVKRLGLFYGVSCQVVSDEVKLVKWQCLDGEAKSVWQLKCWAMCLTCRVSVWMARQSQFVSYSCHWCLPVFS